jgi:hypothetical protein
MTELNLFGPLADGIANDLGEVKSVKFGEGFGSFRRGITGIDVGLDGRLYVVSSEGTIYRIVKGANTH